VEGAKIGRHFRHIPFANIFELKANISETFLPSGRDANARQNKSLSLTNWLNCPRVAIESG